MTLYQCTVTRNIIAVDHFEKWGGGTVTLKLPLFRGGFDEIEKILKISTIYVLCRNPQVLPTIENDRSSKRK